jgi:hypothetical protein
MAVTEVVLFDQLSDENNYSTFHYLGRKEAMKSGHHGDNWHNSVMFFTISNEK